MSRCDFNYRDFNCEHECITCAPKPCPPIPRPHCCAGPQGPKGEPGPAGPSGPFLSSFAEAVGTTQTVTVGGNIAFGVDEDTLDIAGTDIAVDETGSVFTIRRAGLYHVEWSVNVSEATQPILLGLLENGEASSAISNISTSGNYSSGALIYVSERDVPYTVSLHNFGRQITIANPVFEYTAASIRILRFADGPSV